MEVFPKVPYLLLQVLPFVGVLLVLKFVLLEPLLKHLNERDEKTTGALDAVRDLDDRTAQAQGQYEAKVAALRAEAIDLRASRLAEAAKEEAAILAKARLEAEASMGAFRNKLTSDIAGVREELKGSSKGLAMDIASSVLGRPVTSGQESAGGGA